MKHSHFFIITFLSVVVLALIGWYFVTEFSGVAPAFLPPVGNISDDIPNVSDKEPADAENNTDFPLTLPEGFSVEILADNMPGVRAMAIGPRGDLWVSHMKEGMISRVSLETGEVETVFTELANPHGLAFDIANPSLLYVAEETKISTVDVLADKPTFEPVAALPPGGRHVSRTIGFGPDGRLYVALGSTCDVCEEQDDRISTIQVVNLETGELEPYATGLRNSVFFAWHEVDGSMWATEMGRDNLGDDLPPDEINKIEAGKNYGWPICYGNRVHDTVFDTKQYVRDQCTDTAPAAVELQAHVAPLGIGFIPESTAWPEEYWHSAIVAEHGSWNRKDPVGYQLTRIPASIADGVVSLGAPEPFVSGWLTDNDRSLGRPVGVLVRPEGVIYVTDDKAGVIYKISYRTQFTETQDMVRIDGIGEDGRIPVDLTTDPIVLTGSARGPMFFEASFPVEIVDAVDGLVARGLATATSEWTTEDYVPMRIELEYINPPGGSTGTLLLHRDNASGLPEHDLTVSYEVDFVTE